MKIYYIKLYNKKIYIIFYKILCADKAASISHARKPSQTLQLSQNIIFHKTHFHLNLSSTFWTFDDFMQWNAIISREFHQKSSFPLFITPYSVISRRVISDFPWGGGNCPPSQFDSLTQKKMKNFAKKNF